MGIQDRDYYRNEGPSIFDSLVPHGIVCRWLIAINVAVFLLQIVGQTAASATFGLVDIWLQLDVHQVLHGQVWRLLTFAFLHASFWHILFNMLFLWWFGSDVEQLYGRKEFLAIYLVSAVLGGMAYMVWALAMERDNPCVGASGAVTTMMVLCALHFPRRVIWVYFLPMPIWLFAVLSIGKDLLGLVSLQTEVAVAVHLAGAAFAVAYYNWQGRIVEVLRGLRWWRGTRSRVRLKLFNPDGEREEPVAVSANSAPQVAVDEHLEAKLDAVLEKIAKTGKESLTQQEQAILQQAAEMYKRRRS